MKLNNFAIIYQSDLDIGEIIIPEIFKKDFFCKKLQCIIKIGKKKNKIKLLLYKLINPRLSFLFKYRKDITSPILINYEIFHEKKIIDLFELKKIKFVIFLGYGKRISENFLNKFNCYNFHDSLLPRNRGLRATSFEILYNEKLKGYSIHKMNKNFDRGKIIFQKKIIYKNEYWYLFFLKKIYDLRKNIFKIINKCNNENKIVKNNFSSNYNSQQNIIKETTLNEDFSVKRAKKLLKSFGYFRIRNLNNRFLVTNIKDKKITRINHFFPSIVKLLNCFKL
jgi:folate-dependent phosphoribosylglycinamide formyltransferase PurN